MTDHTPGPWHEAYGAIMVGENAPRLIADVVPYDGVEEVANARLIAAAPDLLAVLEWLVSRLDTEWVAPDGSNYDTQMAHAAIAKAIGND